MPHRLAFPICCIFAFMLPRCDRLWPDVYWRSDRYVALEIDSPEQMSIAFDVQGGSPMTLIGPTVFAVGADAHYIVAKQHPAKDALTPGDRSRTNFFYIERTASSGVQEQQRRVAGPLSEQEFRERAAALKLPPFQTVFRDLE